MTRISTRHLLAFSILLFGACATTPNDADDDPELIDDPSVPDQPDEGLADPPPATAAAQVLTPSGLVRSSCVHAIADGETVDDDGVVTRIDGSTYALPACEGEAMPSLEARLAGTTAEAVPAINGWVEAGWWGAPHWMRRLTGNFIVPPAPTNKGKQTVFLFPAMEPATMDRIIQPVLQWGPSAAGGGKYWAIASWYVGPGGGRAHSPLRRVSPGDTLYGSISGSNCTAAGHCQWTIVTKDLTHQKSTTLKLGPGHVPYTQVQGGVLEAYRIDRCNKLPPNGATSFFNLKVYNHNLTKVSPSFGGKFWDRSCHASEADAPSWVVLWW